jgi:hypothetical protein
MSEVRCERHLNQEHGNPTDDHADERGVPPDEWIQERPFDPAEYLHGAAPRYAVKPNDLIPPGAERQSGAGSEDADRDIDRQLPSLAESEFP